MSSSKLEGISGVDTIRNLVGEPPKKIKVPYNLMKTEEISRQGWNAIFLAIIPYCYKCKVPLVWYIYPQDNVLFYCPECKREWVRGKGWPKKKGEK